MANPDDIILPKGTIVELQDKDTPTTWIKVDAPVAIPALGNPKEFINVADLSDQTAKYKTQSPDELPDMDFTFNYVDADPGQVDLKASADVEGGEARVLRVVIPGMAKNIHIPVVVAGFELQPPQRNQPLQRILKTRLNGKITEVAPA